MRRKVNVSIEMCFPHDEILIRQFKDLFFFQWSWNRVDDKVESTKKEISTFRLFLKPQYQLPH